MAGAAMSFQYCDAIASYMDGVHVKIAEAYKPPRKATLPAVYHNKLPDVSKHTYDFSLEKSVLDKLKEWRLARQTNNEARRLRLEERKRRKDSENDGKTPSEDKRRDARPERGDQEEIGKEDSTEKREESSVDDTNEDRGVPIKIAPPPKATILTPQRFSSRVNDLRDITSPCNGGLNYADFDNDTSSPFDNMELKTLNDMEVLAQVLQPTPRWTAPAKVESIIKELSIESSPSNEESNDETTENSADNRNDSNKYHGRNVSIIVEELQRELARPYMENWKPWPDLESPDCEENESDAKPQKPRSPQDSKLAGRPTDLTEDEEKLTRHLSDMGFPFSRAARAVRDLGGDDNKKVVEYLLAVQHLEELGIPGDAAEKALEVNEYDRNKARLYYENLCTLKTLGFREDEASNALVKCNLDRDQALDSLIS